MDVLRLVIYILLLREEYTKSHSNPQLLHFLAYMNMSLQYDQKR